MYDINITEI